MQSLGSKQTARSPKVQGAYDRHRIELWDRYGGNPPCPFCKRGDRVVVEETVSMLILENDFPYRSFEDQAVLRHYMIVPKRHTALFDGFTSEEQHEYWRLLAEYHKKGYSSLTRSAIDILRSVPEHLHTHLFFYLTEEA